MGDNDLLHQLHVWEYVKVGNQLRLLFVMLIAAAAIAGIAWMNEKWRTK